MFTGIVETRGVIHTVEERPQGAFLQVAAPRLAEGLRTGDSVAVNGVCLTVVENTPVGFGLDVVAETLSRTNLGGLVRGDLVNLERAMPAGARFDGHLVQGHVDGTAQVVSLHDQGEGKRLALLVPARLARFVVEKGSVAWDGVSLTVASLTDEPVGGLVEVALIPHTLAVTTLGDRVAGDLVNVEVDILAKYVARYMEKINADSPPGPTSQGTS